LAFPDGKQAVESDDSMQSPVITGLFSLPGYEPYEREAAELTSRSFAARPI
jgi:hypothetical protein